MSPFRTSERDLIRHKGLCRCHRARDHEVRPSWTLQVSPDSCDACLDERWDRTRRGRTKTEQRVGAARTRGTPGDPPSWGLGGGVALLGLPASLTVGQETSIALSHQLWPSAARHGDPCSPPFTGQAPPPASRHRSPGARQSRLAPVGCQARPSWPLHIMAAPRGDGGRRWARGQQQRGVRTPESPAGAT